MFKWPQRQRLNFKFHPDYSKSPTYERVPFQERIPKSNKVSLGTQLTQSAIQDCTVIGL